MGGLSTCKHPTQSSVTSWHGNKVLLYVPIEQDCAHFIHWPLIFPFPVSPPAFSLFFPFQSALILTSKVKWPNKIKQRKTCQGQDSPRGASPPNKLSHHSLNLFYWFADRGSLASSKNNPFWTPLSVSAVHVVKLLWLGESYYHHDSINVIHHLYTTGLFCWPPLSHYHYRQTSIVARGKQQQQIYNRLGLQPSDYKLKISLISKQIIFDNIFKQKVEKQWAPIKWIKAAFEPSVISMEKRMWCKYNDWM